MSTTHHNPYQAQPASIVYRAPCGRCRRDTVLGPMLQSVWLHDKTWCPLAPNGRYVQSGDPDVHLAPLCPSCHADILAADNGPVVWPHARMSVVWE